MGRDSVKKYITFLLANCFFTVGKHVFQQVIGIPMGTDPAPFMANLFLYYYENKFMKELLKRINELLGNLVMFRDILMISMQLIMIRSLKKISQIYIHLSLN